MGALLAAFQKKHLVITTINYSGILLSPFQFYSQEHIKQQKQLNDVFGKLLQEQFKQTKFENIQWKIGKIDQKMQKQRYSPLYNQNVGVQNGKLLNDQQFKQQWIKTFKQNIQKVKGLQPSQIQIDNCKAFDLMCYKALLIFVYELKDFNIKQISKKSSQPYEKFMKLFFDKAFLREQKKIQKTLAAIEKQKVDIMFFQQANKTLIDAIDPKEFSIVQSQDGQSLIFIRRKTFKKIHDHKKVLAGLNAQIKQSLNWNKDTAVAFVDNLILFSGHLSSKKEKNSQQVKKMLQSLQKIKQLYPNQHIIAGIDANSFISQIPPFLKQYPNHPDQYTTLKKRTLLQPQIQKANQIAKASRDVLLSDMNLRKARVVSITDKKAQQVGFLPCEQHPYDHFVVTAYVDPFEE